MQTQINALDFESTNIFVGIDVHLKNWNISIFTQDLYHKTFNQPPSANVLKNYLEAHFPGGTYYSVYEAGFSGLKAHFDLNQLGIQNIVIHPSDVPTTDKEKRRKSDKVDSVKLARSLRNGDLHGIYTPCQDVLEDRTLFRVRNNIVNDLSKVKNRVKSTLYFYGIEIPDQFKGKKSAYWSKKYISWLQSITLTQQSGKMALKIMIEEAVKLRSSLLDVNHELRKLSLSDKYCSNMALIRSVPGIGLLTGILFLSEIDDISRFESNNKLAAMIGIIPDCHSSGENQKETEITKRGHRLLRTNLIESAWHAAFNDPALSKSFSNYCKRMEPNQAIIRIARKLSNRIYFVLKSKKLYIPSVVS